MGKFLARLLLFLIVAAGVGYLLFPTASDQYMLYKNAPLLQTYRQMAAGLDAASAAEKKQPVIEWNDRQFQADIMEEKSEKRVLWSSGEGKSLLAATLGKEPRREKISRLSYLDDGGKEYRAVTQLLRFFILTDNDLRAIAAEDPFTAKVSEASSLLTADRNGVIGILEIPRIGVTLPVYAKRTRERLETGLFYGPGSSLPIGGRGTHAMLAGSGGLDAPGPLKDIGLTGPKLLEDMNQLAEGDLFIFSIMDQTMVYQIDQIAAAPANEDIKLERTLFNERMTIVSATRDGGRLIVRGERIAPEENEDRMIAENAASEPPYWVSLLTLAAPVMAFGLLAMFVTERVMHFKYRLPTEKKEKN